MFWSTRQPAIWLETRVRSLPAIGEVASNVLTPVWIALDMIAIAGVALRGMMLRRWSRHLVRGIREEMGRPGIGSAANGAGPGGQLFNPVHVPWGIIYEQCETPELRRWRYDPLVVKDTLFFAYFGPLEAWCEANCVGTFYLWSDDRGVYRVFTDPTDHLLWNLTFDGPMPRMRELEALKPHS